MKKKNYNIICKNVLLYFCIIVFSNICINDIHDQEKYILSLFDEKLYIQILTDCKKNTTLNNTYQEILLKNFYDYYELKTKKKSRFLNNNLVHDMFISVYNNISINEFNAKSVDKKKIVFNEFIEKNKNFQPISYELFEDLSKELSFLINGYFKDIIQKGVDSSYSPHDRMPISKVNNSNYITYDLLNDTIINNIPNGTYNLLFSDVFYKMNDRHFEKIFQGKNKINIKFDLNEKEKKELLEVNQWFKDLKEYADENPEIKIFCSFYNDGGIIKEEIVSGDYNILNYDDKRFSNIDDLNIISVLPSHNKDTLFRRVFQNKNNFFVINIPECIANKEYIQKKCIELIEQVNLKMNSYVGYRIIKNNTKNNIYFVPVSVSPIYECNHLILNNDDYSFINNKNNNKKKDSLLLKKFITHAQYLIEKKSKINEATDFVDFFNRDLFEDFIFLVCDKSNFSNEKVISFHSYEIENIIKVLIDNLINKIGSSEFMQNKQIVSLPQQWNAKLISFLKDLNVENNANIIFEYSDADKKYIEEYRGQKGYSFFSYEDIQEKRKNKIIKYISKQISGNNTENNIEEELIKAYNEMLYPALFSDSDLIDFTKEIYKINKYTHLNQKDKTFFRIDFISKFFRKISDAEIEKFNSFSQNRSNKFFVNKNYDPSDKELNDLLNNYHLSDVDLEEVRYYLKEVYSQDTKKLKKIIWNILHNNNNYFKKDKNSKKNNLAFLKKIISSPDMDLYSSAMANFNKRFQNYSGSGIIEKHYNQYKALNAKKTTENRSITMTFPSQKNLDEADIELIPGILRCEIFKNIDSFKRTKGQAKCQLESVSGEPGLGKSNSFPFEIKAYKQACIELGIDQENVEGLIIGGIGSSFMMAGSEQANDIWDIVDAAINEKPDIKICILFDECDKAFVDTDTYKKDQEINNNNGKDKFRLDFQTTWKDRFEPTYKHKNVSVKYCSNKNLELFLDPAIKSRTTGKEQILHISTLEPSVMKRLLEKELHENHIDTDLELNYVDIQKIKFIIGNQQRNKDLFKEIISQFIQKFPNKKDQNRTNFMSICELKYLSKKKQNYKKLLSSFEQKKITNIKEEEKKIDFTALLEGVPDNYVSSFWKKPLGTVLNFVLSPNIMLGIASGIGMNYFLCNYKLKNLPCTCIRSIINDEFMEESKDVKKERESKELEKDKIERYAISAGIGFICSGILTFGVHWNYSSDGLSFCSNLDNYSQAYLGFLNEISEDSTMRPNSVKKYQNLDNISKIKPEDRQILLTNKAAECATSKKVINLYYDLEVFKKIQEEYLYGDNDYNEDDLIALEANQFINRVVNTRLKKMQEYELYIEKNCHSIKDFLKDICLRDIGLVKNKTILSGDAIKNIFFDTIFDGKKNDYIVLEAIDKNINDYDKTLNLKRRIIDYHQNIVKLNKKQSKEKALDFIKLEHKVNTEGDNLWNEFNNLVFDIKLEHPIKEFDTLLTFKMRKNYSWILESHKKGAKQKDFNFSKQVAKELEAKNVKENGMTLEEEDEI